MAISLSCIVLVLIPSQKVISALALSTILMFDIPAALRPNLSHSAKLDSTRILILLDSLFINYVVPMEVPESKMT